MPPVRRLLVAAALAVATVVPAAYAQAPLEDTPIPMWVPDGAVADVVKVGTTLVVGGRFEYVGPPTGPFAIVDTADAISFSAGAGFTGSVHKVIADGSGGWFALQDPLAVGGPGGALVHINSGGGRDPNFVAPPTGGRAIAVEAGRLFVATFVSGPGGWQTRDMNTRVMALALAALASTGFGPGAQVQKAAAPAAAKVVVYKSPT